MYHYVLNKGNTRNYDPEDSGPIFKTEFDAHHALVKALQETHPTLWCPNTDNPYTKEMYKDIYATYGWEEMYSKLMNHLISAAAEHEGYRFPAQYIFITGMGGDRVAGFVYRHTEKEHAPTKPKQYSMSRFTVSDKKVWEDYKRKNRDGYGHAILTYASRWAKLMEESISQGHNLEDVAKDLSNDADLEGITGFMYGAAVKILSDVWVHGDQLRCWHNRHYMGDEANEYNKKGATVNPALLTYRPRAISEE
mgnify:CR=1 FL=1